MPVPVLSIGRLERATTLGVAVILQERALRLGSTRAADRFDLIVGAPGSETQLVLSSVFLQPSPLPLVAGSVLPAFQLDSSAKRRMSSSETGTPMYRSGHAIAAMFAPAYASGRVRHASSNTKITAKTTTKTV